jgi:hypothetical protein
MAGKERSKRGPLRRHCPHHNSRGLLEDGISLKEWFASNILKKVSKECQSMPRAKQERRNARRTELSWVKW